MANNVSMAERKPIKLDRKYLKNYIDDQEYEAMMVRSVEAYNKLINRTGIGSEFTGWIDLPVKPNIAENARIKVLAKLIRESKKKFFLVLGIGGSFLGAQAVEEAIKEAFGTQKGIEIIYGGHNLSSKEMKEIAEKLKGKDFAMVAISKSGKTMETSVAFRFYRKIIESRFKTKAARRKRIFIITDKAAGPLKGYATKNAYETFDVPDDIGGRYSVLSAVGLFPIAVAGIDIDELLQGAIDARAECMRNPDNISTRYAALRNILYEDGKVIEIMATYNPELDAFAEWWKQLFGESEGKDQKGLFPGSVRYPRDLHSLGQYIRDGKRSMFQLVLKVKPPKDDIIIENDEDDFDGLNALAGQTVGELNQTVTLATILAQSDGGVPNIVLEIPEISAYYLGYMIYIFELACAISGYILGVNPFDQEGVEDHKRNTRAMNGDKSLAELGKVLWARTKE